MAPSNLADDGLDNEQRNALVLAAYDKKQRNVTGRQESCYNLDNHLDEFLTNDYGLNKSWRCFHPPETDSRTMTTLETYKALRMKRFDLLWLFF